MAKRSKLGTGYSAAAKKARKAAEKIAAMEAGADAPEQRIPTGDTSKTRARAAKPKMGTSYGAAARMEGVATPKPPKIDVQPTKLAAATQRLDKQAAERTQAKAAKSGMTKPPAGVKMATPEEAKALAQKGVAAVRAKKAAASTDVGKRITTEKAVGARSERWASAQQKGLVPATRPGATEITRPRTGAVGGEFRRVGAAKKVQEAAAAQQAGRPVTKPTPLTRIPAQASSTAPAPATATTSVPAARTRRVMGVARRVSGGRAPSPLTNLAAARQKIMSTTVGEGAGRTARATAASYRGVGRVLARAPLAPLGAAVGHSMGAPSGRGKEGAAIGATAASLTAAVPKFMGGTAIRAAAGKVALPLAVADTGYKVGELAVRMGQAAGAQRHLKKQARGLAKMGVSTKKHGFWKGYSRSWEGSTTEAATGLRVKVDPKKAAAATKKMRAGARAKSSPATQKTLRKLREARKKK